MARYSPDTKVGSSRQEVVIGIPCNRQFGTLSLNFVFNLLAIVQQLNVNKVMVVNK